MSAHVLGLTPLSALGDIGGSLKEAFFMFWDTLWALVMGFALSGAVQAFVSRESMQRKLGNHRPVAVARASGYGAISSSCSYAAAAMAKSLFAKGADFVTSMVFMFASTNLVVELGIVLVVLIGWQFAAAEFVGGAVMIVLLVLVGSVFLAGRRVEEARARLNGGQEGNAAGRDPHDEAKESELKDQPWATRLRSKAGWANAASYTMADLTMLRKEMTVGFVVAGFLATLVPTGVWNTVFIHGHGTWTSVENVIVGPFIALISFVCSVGNVPLAAALWKGGISFGGVVSFIFADLIALPLVLIYRKFYGGRLGWRLLGVFWAVMAAAGLATEVIFKAAGLVPTTRPTRIVPEHFSVDYTLILNVVFLAVLGLLYWAYRHRDDLGGGAGYAMDAVCGMQVEQVNAPASATFDGHDFFFCSDRCLQRFEAKPARFATEGGQPAGMEVGTGTGEDAGTS
ncbi:MAG: permease [Actinomycetota bacterium]|nr:permease [Actinomycetota bacterium]